MKKQILSFALVLLLTLAPVPASVFLSPPAGANSDRVYLETDIFGDYSKSYADYIRYPLQGSLIMAGVLYDKGLSSRLGSGSGVNANSSYMSYDISNLGLTRLQGVLGRYSESGSLSGLGSLTITGDGMLLGGFDLNRTASPINIDVAIPPGVSQIHIHLHNGVAFVEAFFSSGTAQSSPSHPPPVGGAFLENGIFGQCEEEYGWPKINTHPQAGPFLMDGIVYYSGISLGPGDGHRVFTMTYDISDRGFTRLQGVFGYSGDTRRTGGLVIQGDGVHLGGFDLSSSTASINIDVEIPPGVRQIDITLQNAVGFGEAVFLISDPLVDTSMLPESVDELDLVPEPDNPLDGTTTPPLEQSAQTPPLEQSVQTPPPADSAEPSDSGSSVLWIVLGIACAVVIVVVVVVLARKKKG